MFVEVRNTAPGELPWVGPELMAYARRSDPLLTYWFGAECIAIVGFVPMGIVTDTAYLWMETTAYTHKHKTAVARLGKLTLMEVHKRYPRIVGECLVGSRSCNWLLWLGAKFGTPKGAAVPFVIEA